MLLKICVYIIYIYQGSKYFKWVDDDDDDDDDDDGDDEDDDDDDDSHIL